jgi:DnaJ-domain-containing protein 1
VSDHFAELGLPRTAWIDSEEVKSSHHQLMASSHPDKSQGDGDRATRLNEARRILEKPATRLRHLLAVSYTHLRAHET